MSSKYHLILMRIRYTRYKTVESSSLFLFTCTFILFIDKFIIRSQFASRNNRRVLQHVCVINSWKAMTVFSLSLRKKRKKMMNISINA